jgi:LPXTG-motif cell wall-anchored protein
LKILLSLLVIPILLALSGSQAFGQLSMGQAPHEVIKVIIDETGTAHVTHVVDNTMTSFKPVQVDMVDGNMANLTVTDGSGKAVEYGTIQKSPLSIILNTSQRNTTLIKYDLINVVTNTDGIWKWNYYEPQDTDFTAFYFPKGVDMIWANDRPVYLGEHGLGQHGNGFALEYIINEPVTIQNVQVAGKNFAVGVRTISGLGNYIFDQSLNTYSFNVDKASMPVTVIMPQDLLAGPYTVTINGNATLHQDFHNNATHAWIGLKPAKSGTVQIKGTTPGQGQQSGSSNNSTIISGSNPPQSGPSDDTTTYLVIGGIIAAGIAGLVIVKKSRSRKAPSLNA